jgi:hypothetical protein
MIPSRPRVAQKAPPMGVVSAFQSIDWWGIRIHHADICKLLKPPKTKEPCQHYCQQGPNLIVK